MSANNEYNKLLSQLGTRIKILRKTQKLSQTELAHAAGVSAAYISLIESGRHTNVSVKVLYAIAEALNTSLQNLLSYINIDEELLSDGTCENQNESDELLMNETAIINTFYPVNYSNLTISSLMEFIIYLPLINDIALRDSLLRIDGDIITGREYYICKLLDKMVKSIPDSQAKQYADAEYTRIKNKRLHRTIEWDELDFNTALESSDQYNAYHALLEKQYVQAVTLNEIKKLTSDISEAIAPRNESNG